MREIQLEPEVADKLFNMTGQAVLCDLQGRALGVFSPFNDHPLVKDLQLEPPLSIEETEELRKVRTGKPLEEILNRLKILR